MTDTAPMWQSVGTTFNEEMRNMTHLRPGDGDTGHRRISSGIDPLSENPVNIGPANLGRTLSRANSLKLKHSKLTPCGKFNRFLARLSWNDRSKHYPFEKSYLQRNPSFIVTPDRSSYNYTFTGADVIKRRPRPHSWRTSRPLAAWKNPNPMDVLANNGNIDLPPFLNEPPSDFPRHSDPNDRPQRNSNHSLGIDAINQMSLDQTSAHKSEADDNHDDFKPRDQGQQVKIAKLAGDDHTSSQHHRRNVQNRDLNSSNTTGDASSSSHNRSSVLNALPQTPVQSIRQTRESTPIASSTSLATSSPSVKTPSHQAQAQTLDDSNAPRSPTSLPSQYRPESWRRSAIIARNSIVDPYDDDSDDPYNGKSGSFAGMWSAYLRRAVAQRAVSGRERERKSAELRDDEDWDDASYSDSYAASSYVDTEGSVNESVSDLKDSNAAESHASSSSSQVYEPIEHHPKYSQLFGQSEESKEKSTPQTSQRSSLGAVHSPRALAAAAQSQQRRSSSTSADSNNISPHHFSRQIEGAPLRYVALFADSQGQGLDTPWQAEENASLSDKASSSSSLPHERHLDVQERSSSRKRPLPSPTRSPLRDLEYPSSSTHDPAQSVESLGQYKPETAASLVRSQSKWQSDTSTKRARNTGSTEHLLHTRQKTMDSLWGAESDDSRD